MKKYKRRFWLIAALSLGMLLSIPETQAQRKKNRGKASKRTANEKPTSLARSDAEAEYYFIEGLKFFTLEKYDKALGQFEKARGFVEKGDAIDFKIAETYLRLQQVQAAEEYAKKALDQRQDNPYYYLILADIYKRQSKLALAANTYQALLNSEASKPEYYYELAAVYQSQSEFEKAIQAYEKIEENFGIQESLTAQKQSLYVRLGQTDKAVLEAEKLMKAQPYEKRHLISLADLLLNSGQEEKAQSILEEAAQEKRLDPRVYLLLAQIYQKQGKLERAREYLNLAFANPDLKADDKVKLVLTYLNSDNSQAANYGELAAQIVATHPRSAQAHTLYADILLRENKIDEALVHYLLAAQSNPNIHPKIWQQILAIEAGKNDLDSLEVHAEKALELYPNQALFWFYSGMAHLGKKNYEEAVFALEEGKRLAFNQPELQHDFSVYLGDAYFGMEEYSESDRSYEAALAKVPEDRRALNNYAYHLALRKEKLDRALTLAEKLIETNPNVAAYLDTYAWVLYARKNYKKARKFLEEALEIQDDADIREHYGDVLFKLGEVDAAMLQWQKAKDLGSQSPQIDKKISDRKLYE